MSRMLALHQSSEIEWNRRTQRRKGETLLSPLRLCALLFDPLVGRRTMRNA